MTPSAYRSARVSTSTALKVACSGAMYNGVPITVPKLVNRVCSESCIPLVALANPKSMTPRHGLAVVRLDEDIGWLQVAVDDSLLMGVLYRRANLRKQHKAFRHVELVLVAELIEWDPLHQLHHEKRQTVAGRAGVEQLGDIRVIHERNRLPLGLEAREDRGRAAALGPNQLDGDLALDRFGLLGHPDAAHAPFADRLQELVPAGDERPGRSDQGLRGRRRPEGGTGG